MMFGGAPLRSAELALISPFGETLRFEDRVFCGNGVIKITVVSEEGNNMTSLVLYSIPLVIYAFVAKWNSRSEWRDIAQQLGLVVGQKSYYWWALGFAFLGIAFAWVVHFTIPESVKSEQLMAMSRFAGERLTATNALALFVFGMIETGLGEELFFRGLIAGWLGWRQKLWVANVR